MRGRLRAGLEIMCGLLILVIGGLAVNAGSSSSRWPGILDIVRRYPWWTVLGIAVVFVLGEVMSRLKKDKNLDRPSAKAGALGPPSAQSSSASPPAQTENSLTLPKSVDFLTLIDARRPFQEYINRRWDLGRKAKRFEAVLGIDEAGSAVMLDLIKNGPSGLICGYSGAGTSEAMRTIALSLALAYPPSRFRLHYLNVKGIRYDFERLPHVVKVSSISPTAAEDAVAIERILSRGAKSYLNDKLRMLRARNVDSFDEYNSLVAAEDLLPLDLLVVDEFYSYPLSQALAEIARSGRPAGFGVLAVCPRPDVISASLHAASRFVIALGRVILDSDGLGFPLSDLERQHMKALASEWIPGRGIIMKSGGVIRPLQMARAESLARDAHGGYIVNADGRLAKNVEWEELLSSFPAKL